MINRHFPFAAGLCGLVIASSAMGANSEALPGYTPGAEVIRIAPNREQIDSIGNIVYA